MIHKNRVLMELFPAQKHPGEFCPIEARFVKITFEKAGTAIDEVEAFMVQPPSLVYIPTNKPKDNQSRPTWTPVPTDTLVPTNTPIPIPTSTNTPVPTNTPLPTDTPTPIPTDTSVPPTDTSVPPTDTSVPPTDTSAPPMDTPMPAIAPTDTAAVTLP
jgi:Predicted solute binding protein